MSTRQTPCHTVINSLGGEQFEVVNIGINDTEYIYMMCNDELVYHSKNILEYIAETEDKLADSSVIMGDETSVKPATNIDGFYQSYNACGHTEATLDHDQSHDTHI